MAPSSDQEAVPPQEADIALWLTTYGPGLRTYFAKRAGPNDAEDLVQEVFLRLQTKATGEPIDNVKGYLFRIAQNVLASRARYGMAKGRPLQTPFDSAVELIEDISPERILLGKLDYARAIVAIKTLPPRAQTAFLLHRFEEMTYPMIAKRMGIKLDAVKALMSRALAHISAELEGEV